MSLVIGCLACLFWPAMDLSKLDRKLLKEPAYQNQPLYALLVFGPETPFKVWLVLDGQTLYVDVNGNGDLTEADEKIHLQTEASSAWIQNVVLKDGPRQHTMTWFSVCPLKSLAPFLGNDPQFKKIIERHPEQRSYSIKCIVQETMPGRAKEVRYIVNSDDLNDQLQLATEPSKAPVIHFGGAWQMNTPVRVPVLYLESINDFYTGVGCPGLGAGTFAFACYEEGVLPDRAIPKLTLHLPRKTADLPPLIEHHYLRDRC